MSRAHAQPERRKRVLIAGVAVAAALSAVTAAAAFAGGEEVTGSIACPRPVVPAVPAAAQAEVQRELANLDKQIAEANERLRTSAGEGGPNFVQNAILGPLASKRVAALNRIETAIGRVADKPDGLERFATCGLGDAPAVPEPSAPAGGSSTPPSPSAEVPDGGAAGGAIACPAPALPAVPSAAQAEVQRELANLDKQIAEANERLRTSVGQGGPDFVQNAILGPLEDKRVAALNRIETAVGRVAVKPEGLERFATCQLR
ncbi:hypothetical protein SAMN05216553_109277 [Lentzea fradiae]|uniref:Uncharacterized protein n=1 Tax=Lentzea fradiae TaxID=200378 RepID=A0A1G7VJU2_9PSEU|nr:hypothetical protein [Lentzea fradiae]SDG60014.1 hypothetical protein SAMN05216553_109277 [Lentzea fradiae]